MKGREPRKKGFLLCRLPSMNRSFQTKPQSYRVKQQEGSEELSSHTGHKCSPGAAQLGLVGHSSVKAPPAGQVCRQLNGRGIFSSLCRNPRHMFPSTPTSGALHTHRCPSLGWVSSGPWAKASPGPRTLSNAPEASNLEAANQATVKTPVRRIMNLN